MFVIIRQHGTVYATMATRCRKHLSSKAIADAEEFASKLGGLESGYYDIVLTKRPTWLHDTRYELDSHIAIR